MHANEGPIWCNLVNVFASFRLLPTLTDNSASISDSSTITTLQFSNWNPNINGLCDSLQEGDYVCIGAPGGSYIPPLITKASTNATLQQPGEVGAGVSNIPTVPYQNLTTPTNTSTSTPSTSSGGSLAAPSPTQKGFSTSCARYNQAKHGDYCSTFAQANNIPPTQLYALNSALGSAGENCNTGFWSGYYYCVASNVVPALDGQNSTTTTTPNPVATALSTVMSTILSTVDATTPCTSTTTSTPAPIPTPTVANHAAPLPSPTQQGVASPCAKYAQAHTGDTCTSFAAANGIMSMDLYERNTALGPKGENCGTQFWVGYYYCGGGTD